MRSFWLVSGGPFVTVWQNPKPTNDAWRGYALARLGLCATVVYAAPTVVQLGRSANTRGHQHAMARARVIPGANANAKEKVRAETANAAKGESAATTTALETAGAAVSKNNDLTMKLADAAN